MKSWKKPTNKMIDRALGSVKKETDRQYFFSQLKNPMWIQPLAERGYFQSPPGIRRFDDGSIQFPFWPELRYLKNVSSEVPNEIVNLILNLPKVDNSRVYDGILDIALQLRGQHSVKLKSKILEYTSMEHQLSSYKYAELLAHWTKENQVSAALELSKILVEFAPDPRSKEKQDRRKEVLMDLGTTLYPSVQLNLNSWEYSEIMVKGVRSLAEKKPYEVACLLIHTTADMIHLRKHQVDSNKETDLSEIWCPRLHRLDNNHEDPEKELVHTLTFACEKVYEKSPNVIEDLDRTLRKQRWKIFKRVRQHLYAQYPCKKNKPWIRKLILEREDYHQWPHSYEFQQMIRAACDHFKEKLLTKSERVRIFDAIRSGPSKEDFRGIMGKKFTEEHFQKRQHYFHQQQLIPFASVLFGEYETYFRKLESDETSESISDEDYPPFRVKSGFVSNRSPYSSEDIDGFKDEELLACINEWEKEDEFTERDPFVRVNIEAFANAFQSIFKESIISDTNRLRFWMENREKIERPIYVRMMIYAMQAHVKEKDFKQLNEWLTFCEWVLSHPDSEHNADYRLGDESRENPHWSNSRRAVEDFINTCLEKNIDVPITAREQLVKLLELLCTQFDWRLDEYKSTTSDQYDAFTEGINNTRSRALEALVKFGFWLRRHDSDADVSEITSILERRFLSEAGYPLTLPEYAVLGRNYPWIVNLNETWAIKHKLDFFPQDALPAWLAAYESLVKYSEPSTTTFEILREDFDLALQHLADFKKRYLSREEPIDILGEHLLTYYLWEVYPLKGEESLLAQYYQQTNSAREHWASLFNYIGLRLRNSGKHLNQNLKDRIIDFFNWRMEVREPTELCQFTFWLEAECLEADWRLDAYSKILDICKVEDRGIRLKALCGMLPDHTAKVVECLAKLTDGIKEDNLYILTEEAKTILKAGFKSGDESVRQNADFARENLLKAGRFDLLDLDD